MSSIKKLPLNIAHRGHALTLENTMRSFHESIDMGAQMLELDVRLSRDGVPVVFHDHSLKRIAGLKAGNISTRTAHFLTNLDLGQGFRMPTLEQALRELTPRIPVNVELKFHSLNYRPCVMAVGNLIESLGLGSRVLISSFFHQSLDILNRTWPNLATAPLFGVSTGAPHPEDLEKLQNSAANWQNDLPFARPAAVVDYKMIKKALAKQFAEASLTLLTYTVDEPKEMQRLIDLGIAGIITNRPDVLHQVLAKNLS